MNSWNVVSVINMAGMFKQATSFNQDLNIWNVSAASTMWSMFQSAASFNNNIQSWDIARVANAATMFNGATLFNQNLCAWVDTFNITVAVATYTLNMFNGTACLNTSSPSPQCWCLDWPFLLQLLTTEEPFELNHVSAKINKKKKNYVQQDFNNSTLFTRLKRLN